MQTSQIISDFKLNNRYDPSIADAVNREVELEEKKEKRENFAIKTEPKSKTPESKIPRRYDIRIIEKFFDEAKLELESNGYQIISLQQLTRARIEQGKDSFVANSGSHTREGFLYVPRKGIFLVRNSPIMANAQEATQAHITGKEFYLTDKQVEESLEDSVKVKVKHCKSIPTKRFGENELTTYAFGDNAKAYGEFLKDVGINKMYVYLDNLEQKPFVRQAWLNGLGGDDLSDLVGYNGCEAVCGIRYTDTTKNKRDLII